MIETLVCAITKQFLLFPVMIRSRKKASNPNAIMNNQIHLLLLVLNVFLFNNINDNKTYLWLSFGVGGVDQSWVLLRKPAHGHKLTHRLCLLCISRKFMQRKKVRID